MLIALHYFCSITELKMNKPEYCPGFYFFLLLFTPTRLPTRMKQKRT